MMRKSMMLAAIALVSVLGCDTSMDRTTMDDRDRATTPSTPPPAATAPAPPPPSESARPAPTPSPSESARTAPDMAPGASDTETMSEADRALAQRVSEALQEDSELASVAHSVTVHANNGVVTLHGSVNNPEQRTALATKAQQVAGVTRLVNNLEVASASS